MEFSGFLECRYAYLLGAPRYAYLLGAPSTGRPVGAWQQVRASQPDGDADLHHGPCWRNYEALRRLALGVSGYEAKAQDRVRVHAPGFGGIFGIHKAYLQKTGMQLLYMFTLGLLDIGLIYDAFTMDAQVDNINKRLGYSV